MVYHVAYTAQGRQPAVLGTCIVFSVISILTVSLRLYARRMTRTGYWFDDIFLLAALPLVLALNAVVLYELSLGMGMFPIPQTLENTPTFLKSFYAAEILYDTALGMIRMSILLLFYRVFPVRYVRIGFWVLTGVNLAWFLGTILVIIFQCNPISKSWYQEMPGTCVSLPGFYLGQSIPSIVTDFALFCMPIRPVWKLQMPLNRKLAILGIFMIGFVAVLGSILRIYYVMQGYFDGNATNIFYASSLGEIWTVAELNVSMLCASLPSLRPVLSLLIPSFRGGYVRQNEAGEERSRTTTTTHGSSKWRSKAGLNMFGGESEGARDSALGSAAQVEDGNFDRACRGIEMDTLVNGQRAESSEDAIGISGDGIAVRKDIDVYAARA